MTGATKIAERKSLQNLFGATNNTARRTICHCLMSRTKDLTMLGLVVLINAVISSETFRRGIALKNNRRIVVPTMSSPLRKTLLRRREGIEEAEGSESPTTSQAISSKLNGSSMLRKYTANAEKLESAALMYMVVFASVKTETVQPSSTRAKKAYIIHRQLRLVGDIGFEVGSSSCWGGSTWVGCWSRRLVKVLGHDVAYGLVQVGQGDVDVDDEDGGEEEVECEARMKRFRNGCSRRL